MERVRARWWILLLTTIGLALAIYLLAPRYTDAQVAGSAAAFRTAVADAGDGRTIAAGLVDILFVGSYLTLALALSRGNRVSRAGVALMMVAGVADVIENLLVVFGVTKGVDLTDGGVDLIRLFGTIKWAGVVFGGLVILAGLFVDRRPDR